MDIVYQALGPSPREMALCKQSFFHIGTDLDNIADDRDTFDADVYCLDKYTCNGESDGRLVILAHDTPFGRSGLVTLPRTLTFKAGVHVETLDCAFMLRNIYEKKINL